MSIFGEIGTQLKYKIRSLIQISQPSFKSRAARVPLADLHDIKISMVEPTQIVAGALKARNISTTGMALQKENFPANLKIGQKITLTIQIKNENYRISSRLVHVREDLIAIMYEEAPEEYIRALADYFEAEISALNVIYVNPQMLKPVVEGHSHWIQGNNNCGLYWISLDNGEVKNFELTFLGYRWVGQSGKSCKFSQLLDNGAENGPCPPDMIQLAEKIMNHMPCLEGTYRNKISQMLRA